MTTFYKSVTSKGFFMI